MAVWASAQLFPQPTEIFSNSVVLMNLRRGRIMRHLSRTKPGKKLGSAKISNWRIKRLKELRARAYAAEELREQQGLSSLV